MKKFSDFNIKRERNGFVGDKINKSKFMESNSDKCLFLQIEIEGTKRVLFTGSKILTEMISQVPKEELPFETVIIKQGETFEFS